ncbi:MAG: tRNA (adenosine(37)-N6)-threonylcarbamoyltransferase complex ATPase subunit type 1 TsaE [Gallionellaceae bacterium]|nr:tRNA (adenosine(37)-N6)-threonylcarbamoyltransferase complex ATPase subunit type 1 TsaE [Gallionellaceae bacterium]
MHKSDIPSISLPDEAATAAFAARLAQALRPGMVTGLRGTLGAGKTTIARSLLRALRYAGRGKSPTYTLLEQYEIGALHLRHFDLYRFRDKNEWNAAGFHDEFNGRNICLIEWPENAEGLLPAADIELLLKMAPQGRTLELRANTTLGTECLDSLQN